MDLISGLLSSNTNKGEADQERLKLEQECFKLHQELKHDEELIARLTEQYTGELAFGLEAQRKESDRRFEWEVGKLRGESEEHLKGLKKQMDALGMQLKKNREESDGQLKEELRKQKEESDRVLEAELKRQMVESNGRLKRELQRQKDEYDKKLDVELKKQLAESDERLKRELRKQKAEYDKRFEELRKQKEECERRLEEEMRRF